MKKTIQTGRGTITVATLLAIWSVSSVKSLPGLAISPSLGSLDKIFPHTTHLEIQMLSSLPSLLIIPCVLLAGKLSESRDKLKILYAGLALFFISGMLCLFAQSMWLLILFNCLLGIGAGMVIPLTTGLVADYFSGRYRVRQLGISSSISNLTLVLTTALAGWLASIDWHFPFLVYAIPGIALLLTLTLRRTPAPATVLAPGETPEATASPASAAATATVTTPAPGATPSAATAATASAASSSPATATPAASVAAQPSTDGIFGAGIDSRKLMQIMAVYFFATYAVLPVIFNLPFLMQHYGMSSSASGMMISIFFLAIMLPGFFITPILDRFGRHSIFLSFAMIAAGLALILLLRSEWAIGLGSFLTGFGYGVIQPVAYDKTVAITRPDRATFALSLVMVVSYLAILVCPFIVAFFRDLFHAESATFPFLFNGLLTLAVTLVSFRYQRSFALGVDPSQFK